VLRVAILADDLTGALDSAEPFARCGASVTVATSLEAARAKALDAYEVVALNVDSRQLQPEAAARAFAEAWACIEPWRPDCLFKKVDSRMKGNVVAELSAIIGMAGRTGAIIAPAIPAIGRLVSGGAITGFGVDQPVAISDLPGWREEWSVPDCGDEAAMAAIAEHVIAQRSSRIAVGASGLAEAMAAALRAKTAAGTADPAPRVAGTPRILMAIGSRDPITLEQIAVLQGSNMLCSTITGEEAPSPGLASADLILLLPPPAEQAPGTVAEGLAALALALADQEGISTILLSGGDTAAAFVRRAAIELLTPLGLVAQGMPVSRGESVHGEFVLITKSGGFGSRGALIDAARQWRRQFQC